MMPRAPLLRVFVPLVWMTCLGLVGCDHDAPAETDLAIAPDLATVADDLAPLDADAPDAAVEVDAAIADLVTLDQTPPLDLAPSPDLVALPDLAPLLCGSDVVDVATDPANCGACGHVCGCGSTTCSNGVCVPTTIATGLSAPYALALDGTTLYFGTDTDAKLWTLPTAGGVDPTLNRSGLSTVRGIVFGGSTIYLTRLFANTISFGAKDGGGAIASFSGQIEQTATGIAIDGTRLYWANYGNGSEQGAIRSGPLSNGLLTSNVVAAPQNGAERVALDADYVYWTSSIAGTVSRFPLVHDNTSTVTTIASGQAQPFAIAVDSGFVYWTNRADGTVRRKPKDGSAGGDAIATGQTTPSFLVIDTSYAYFTDFAAGAVRRVPLAGGETPTNLATLLNNPVMLTQDATCLYATVAAGNVASAGSIVKIGK